MRRCPKCNRIYPSSEVNRFCLSDGTSLLTPEEAASASTLQNHAADFPTLEIKDEPVLNLSALEKAAQINRAREIQELRESLYQTEKGVEYALEAVKTLLSQIEIQAKAINAIHPRVNIVFKLDNQNEATISSGGCQVKVSWDHNWFDTLEGGELWLQGYRDVSDYDKEDETFEVGFAFDVNPDFQMGWRELKDKRFVSSEKLAGECLDRLLHLVAKDSN